MNKKALLILLTLCIVVASGYIAFQLLDRSAETVAEEVEESKKYNQVEDAEEVAQEEERRTHIEIDSDSSEISNIYRETNSTSFTTHSWKSFSILSDASQYGFTLNIPKEWEYTGSTYFLLNGEKVAEFNPPGIVVLNEGQSCFDVFAETVKIPDPDWGVYETLLHQETVSHEGKEFTWVQTRFTRTGELWNKYCVQEGNLAWAINFFERAGEPSQIQEIMASVDIVSETASQ